MGNFLGLVADVGATSSPMCLHALGWAQEWHPACKCYIFWGGGFGPARSNSRKEHRVNTRTYVSGTDIYPHMPILRPHAARFHERRISSVTFTSAHLYGNACLHHYMRLGVARALADSSHIGLLGEQSF